MKSVFAAALFLAFLAGAVFAQEPVEPARPAASQDEDEEPRTEPVRKIRVLQNPYDIASFYRSSQGPGFFGYESASDPRYPIAGYYRQRQGTNAYGYGPFWTNGYGDRGRGRGRVLVGFRRSIGENGDIFLLAPTFLSPVGPLTGAFFGER